jgi:hypothetical protein
MATEMSDDEETEDDHMFQKQAHVQSEAEKLFGVVISKAEQKERRDLFQRVLLSKCCECCALEFLS